MRPAILPALALAAGLAATLAAALPAEAQRVLTPEEFDAATVGRTFHFDRGGAPFGAEQYFEDGRVIWSFDGGQCQRGIWFPNAEGDICFVYEDDPEPQCWAFLEREDGRFAARLDGADPAEDLVTRRIDDDPLDCPAPDIGV